MILATILLFLLIPFYQVFLLELPGKHDNPFAQHHQIDGGLLQITEQGECPFFTEIGLDSFYRLVVVVTDSWNW